MIVGDETETETEAETIKKTPTPSIFCTPAKYQLRQYTRGDIEDLLKEKVTPSNEVLSIETKPRPKVFSVYDGNA